MPARVRTLDSDQTPIAIDIAPAESTELAEAKARPESHVEETDVKAIRFVTESIVRRKLEQGAPDPCARPGSPYHGGHQAGDGSRQTTQRVLQSP